MTTPEPDFTIYPLGVGTDKYYEPIVVIPEASLDVRMMQNGENKETQNGELRVTE